MKCPVDGATLAMMDRSGVEIDYCPQCRGVWLDRGELDKILDRSQAPVALEEPVTASSPPPPREEPRRDEPRRDDRDRDGYRPGPAMGRPPERPVHGDDRRDYGDKLGEWRDRDEDGYRKKRRKGFLEDLFDF